MEKSGFFNANLVNEEYDRVYLAEDFASYFESFISNGVFAKYSNQLQVIAESDPAMSVQVSTGRGWINGYFYENTDLFHLAVELADGVLNRIDSVVLQLDFQSRAINLKIKKGTPASSPVAPTLTRNNDYYELQLATIAVNAGAINVTQAQITDTRLNTEVCGWVTGTVTQIDTTTLFEQFNSYFEQFKQSSEDEFNEWETEQKADFESWFETIKDQLSGDVAANLQNQVLELDGRVTTVETGKENAYTLVTITLDKDKWVTAGGANTYSFEDTYPVSKYKLELYPANTCDEDARDAWDNAWITGSVDSNDVKALNEVPTVDIPCYLKIIALENPEAAKAFNLYTTDKDTGVYAEVENKDYNLSGFVNTEEELQPGLYNLDIDK